MEIDIETPDWGVPFLEPMRYKGLKGGRGSGKSNFFAELAVEESVMYPDLAFVCIREIQKSLQFSAKRLIESKIRKLGVSDYFDITDKEIRRRRGEGLFIFQGMQDHTADSIKSLEGFDRAWCEEAQRLSARSLKLLRPTIRKPGSELWFSWNPDQPTDPIDAFLAGDDRPHDAVVEHVNYDRNPFLPDTLRLEMEYDRRVDPEAYEHVWLGGYNKKQNAQVMGGKWVIDEFDPEASWDGPYFGADWGFSTDPTTLVKVWINGKFLMVEYEFYKVGLEITDIKDAFKTIPGAENHKIRADNARPETISHVKNAGMDIQAVEKGPGSVEDGIAFLRSFEKIIIHQRCLNTINEARLYSYKIDRLSGDVLPDIVDKHNHCWDAVRYAVEPIMKQQGGGFIIV